MRTLLLVAALRFYGRRPAQLVLAVLGISLGVAVYVGVALANDSARRGFEISSAALLGGATHQLLPIDAWLPQNVYRSLVLEQGIRHATPVLEATAVIPDYGAAEWPLLGIDVLRDPRFSAGVGSMPQGAAGLTALLTEPGAVLIPPSLAVRLDLGPGDRFDIEVAGRLHSAFVAGRLDADGGGAAADVLVADLATAQEWLAAQGRLSRIDLILDEPLARQLAARAVQGTVLVSAAARDHSFLQLREAFNVNLTALSLLALLVGVFLVFATISFTVVQRRTTLGVARALGVSRRELLGTVLAEAGLIGLCAAPLGLWLGNALATQLVELVLRTVDDLYFRAELRAVAPGMAVYWQGLALGVLAALAAGLAPALEAAGIPPHAAMSRAALERQALRASRRAAWLALPCFAGAALVLSVSGNALLPAFGALFLGIMGAALLIPGGTRALLRLAEPVAQRYFGLPARLAVKSVAAAMSRTGIATAALAIAFATVIGVGSMTESFRQSFTVWLDATLLADIYLSDPNRGDQLDGALIDGLLQLPGIDGLSRIRIRRLPTPDGDLELRAQAPGPAGWGLNVDAPDPGKALDALATGAGVLLSEPLARRRRLGIGDRMTLPTSAGPLELPILGLYRDYNLGGGAVLMALDLYRRHWRDWGLSGIGVHLSTGADRAAAAAAVEALLTRMRPGVRLTSNDTIRARSLAIFERSFRITDVLRALAGLVAFLGMLSALLAVQLERSRELAVLRALGMSPGQMRSLSLAQTGLLGIAAGVLAIPVGLGLAALLVYVINRRSFGWSMELALTPQPLLLGLALAVGAALLAGIYPAFKSARGNLAAALRAE